MRAGTSLSVNGRYAAPIFWALLKSDGTLVGDGKAFIYRTRAEANSVRRQGEKAIKVRIGYEAA